MRGWKSCSYTELQIAHLRPMSSKKGWYKGRFRNGITDYLLGYHPLFELARAVYRMTHQPYVIGGLLLLAGYASAALRNEQQIVNDEEKYFIQKQQLHRLSKLEIR